MASESLLSCISRLLRHLRNQWPWISLRGHSRSYILAALESPCTTLYRPLIVAFALSSTVSEILPVLYAPSQLCKQVSKCTSAWIRMNRYNASSHSTWSQSHIKQYFAILAAFKESMTSNLRQRSFKVIVFGTNRKRVYIFLLVVNSNLDPIMHRFRDTAA